ncbi:putative elongation factor 1-gamma (EF-1-gamma) [Trypanosoma cruzi]|nr:putative elongation factor 1-gamma (EF-1-gamma) [Trypanosoma cruzi]
MPPFLFLFLLEAPIFYGDDCFCSPLRWHEGDWAPACWVHSEGSGWCAPCLTVGVGRHPPQPAVRRHANLSWQREVKDFALELDALRPFSLRLCACGAHGSFLQCDVDGVAAACAFVHVLCGGLLFLSHGTALVCGRLGGAERCEELSVGGCRLRPAHWGLPHTRGFSRQPFAAPWPWIERCEGLLHAEGGQRDAVRDGEAGPHVAAAHGARATVRVERCAHGWGEVAARHCGAVCVVCGRGMAAIVRDVEDTELFDWEEDVAYVAAQRERMKDCLCWRGAC